MRVLDSEVEKMDHLKQDIFNLGTTFDKGTTEIATILNPRQMAMFTLYLEETAQRYTQIILNRYVIEHYVP
jgi:uncharacterized protein YfdQ (DUF2303 family)